MARYPRVQAPWLLWDENRLRRNVGVYVHVPFCLARCRYCDFLTYAHDPPAGMDMQRYVDALMNEIKLRGGWARQHYAARGRLMDSVFFGGGTPTRLPKQMLAELVQAVRKHFPLAADAEITVEANPDTLGRGYCAALAKSGVNRLSIGIQATQSRHLRFLGRTHRWRDIAANLASARSVFTQLSFDLIYGIPRLSIADLRQSLRRMLALKPTHISAYALTLEPGTPYAAWAEQFPQQVPGEARVAAQMKLVAKLLADHGYCRYEVSNYARPGAECYHNLRYWRGGDYLGLGLGAASRIGTAVVNNARDWDAYAMWTTHAGGDDDPVVAAADECASSAAPAADAFLMLRTRLGVLHAADVPPSWVQRGWVHVRNGRAEVTCRGLNYADLLARELG